MHDTAFQIGVSFLENYAYKPQSKIVEIGSLNINGSLREGCPEGVNYVGLDFEPGDGVDLIVRPGQPLPLESDGADAVVSSSQMEHDPEFWTTILELFRVVKPGGFVYINAPSNGNYHAYPSDNWRFFPDAGKAFAAWGRKNNYEMTLLESFTAKRMGDNWNDFVCVFYKGKWDENEPVKFISDSFASENVWRFGATEVMNAEALTEDQRLIKSLEAHVAGLTTQMQRLKDETRDLGDRLRAEIVRLETKMARRSERAPLRRFRRFLQGAFQPILRLNCW